MPKNVRKIPASVNLYNAVPITNKKKRKVAAYARVSTDQEEQLTSYEAQVDYYTNYIKSRDDWEFVDVYTDEGISGTNTTQARLSSTASPSIRRRMDSTTSGSRICSATERYQTSDCRCHTNCCRQYIAMR